MKTFPNNWQEIADTPSEAFAEIAFDDFMEMMMMWHIPSSHCCIMRCENKATGKITEYAYQRVDAAKKRLTKLSKDKQNEILVADDESIALFKTKFPFDVPPEFDDPLN